MVKKRFNILKEYRKCFYYLRESKIFIYIAIGIFLFFFLIGFLIPAPSFLEETILNLIREIIQKTAGMSQAELIGFIFLNNIQSSFFGIMLGFFLGVFPVISAMFNGYLLGFVSSYTVQEEGFFYLWRLFPHGIFELPAVFISFGLGIKFGSFLLKKNKKKFFRYFLSNSLRTFVLIVIPLLIISALIEGSLIFLFG
ncbi:MAG: stage II sporulation protein M [Nanoarchaeota archaeon]|nr:stage II sporulation protein M [Nanoarchaeota archaeon]MBU3926145.1 stage II sporulation protein M [Patescibacteria group bacterium]